MSITTETYDQLKIDKLKLHLQTQSDKGVPRYYEIFVDNLKVVQKTTDVAEFDSYEDYMTENTEKIRILIYSTSTASPKNDQYNYLLKKTEAAYQQPVNVSLSGLEIENRIEEKLQTQRDKWEQELLKRELEETKKQLEEAEVYAEKLEAELIVYRGKKLHLGNVNLGELASVVVEGFIRRNPQVLSKLPGGEALAGIIEQDNKEKANAAQGAAIEPEVSFKKKSDPSMQETVTLSEEEKGYISFMRGIAESFDENELLILTQVVNKLEEDTSQLKPVAELLSIDVSKF